MNAISKSPWQAAWQLSLPVILAYIPLGLVFGVLATQSGYSAYTAIVMSILIYGGAVQFVALGIMNEGGSLITITLSCLFIALRNSFYGLSLLERFNFGKWSKSYLIFSLVDSTFAIFITQPGYPDKQLDKQFCLLLSTFIYASWVLGTIIGTLTAGYLNINLNGLEFVLVAFFVIMLLEQFFKTKNAYPIIIALISFVTMLLIAPEYLLLGSISISFFMYLIAFYWREYRV